MKKKEIDITSLATLQEYATSIVWTLERLSLSVFELVAHTSVEGIQQRWCDGWQMVTAGREVRRYRRQIRVRPHVQNQIHADQYVEQEVAMEQPVSYKKRLISAYDINIMTVILHCGLR